MIVTARECHAVQMASAGLRAADVAEVKAASGLEPGAALLRCLELSTKSWAAVDEDGNAFVLFGVGPYPDTTIGCPWLLATDEVAKHRKEFLRLTRRYIAEMSEGFTHLVNHVDVRHVESIRWLNWAGFKFDRLEPHYGSGRQPFLRFVKDTHV